MRVRQKVLFLFKVDENLVFYELKVASVLFNALKVECVRLSLEKREREKEE